MMLNIISRRCFKRDFNVFLLASKFKKMLGEKRTRKIDKKMLLNECDCPFRDSRSSSFIHIADLEASRSEAKKNGVIPLLKWRFQM